MSNGTRAGEAAAPRLARTAGSGRSAVHTAFGIGVALKGIDGVLEIVGAALPLFVSPARVAELVTALTRHELSRDPHDLLATHLLRAAGNLSAASERFASLYLLSHGIVKVLLVWALLRSKLWAYPTAIVIFAAFGAYQMYRWSISHSLAMVALTVLDVFVIGLTWMEYRRLREERRAQTG